MSMSLESPGEFAAGAESDTVDVSCDIEQVERVVAEIRGRADRPFTVRLDCRDIRKVNSESLNRMISAHLRLKDAGGELCLVNVDQPLGDVLRLTRLDRLFRVQPVN